LRKSKGDIKRIGCPRKNRYQVVSQQNKKDYLSSIDRPLEALQSAHEAQKSHKVFVFLKKDISYEVMGRSCSGDRHQGSSLRKRNIYSCLTCKLVEGPQSKHGALKKRNIIYSK
jgi:hypothetical protein